TGRGFVRRPSLIGMTRSVMACVAGPWKAVHNSLFAQSLSIAGNMPYPSVAVAVAMERAGGGKNPRQAQKWARVAARPYVQGGEVMEVEGERVPRMVHEDSASAKWLHPGFTLELFHDESEGYYLNLASPQPFVFVNWLDESGAGVPKIVTVSYNEAARMMDG